MAASGKILTSRLYDLQRHMQPVTRIAPFHPAYWEKLLAGPVSHSPAFLEKPSNGLNAATQVKFYDSGRTAILAALKNERLRGEDEVLIITTTQGPYISSCVTKTIEKVCRWSRKFTAQTRMALVIHEFGFPCQAPEISACKRKGIPVLEDCAYSLGTRMENSRVANTGDYAVYSLTKHYPVPFGGILLSQKPLIAANSVPTISPADQKFLIKILRNASRHEKDWNKMRRKNWDIFNRRLKPFGVRPFFKLDPGVVPGAFVLRLPKRFNGVKIKRQMVAAGIECTEYYGMGGFYFPVHQFLNGYEREYILHHFLKR